MGLPSPFEIVDVSSSIATTSKAGIEEGAVFVVQLGRKFGVDGNPMAVGIITRSQGWPVMKYCRFAREEMVETEQGERLGRAAKVQNNDGRDEDEDETESATNVSGDKGGSRRQLMISFGAQSIHKNGM
ncbi:hypothetical protein V6N13_126183 [Hibiscus sabdariffa]|uniref:Uncharacterized protein n=2 Tax=Hibiscus sabdariffa TaxID=183260 RepID=A0ABR2ADR9_9ROSI